MLVSVKNVSLAPVDLQSGVLLTPGRIAHGVDNTNPLVRSYLNVGSLVEVASVKPTRKTTSKKEPTS